MFDLDHVEEGAVSVLSAVDVFPAEVETRGGHHLGLEEAVALLGEDALGWRFEQNELAVFVHEVLPHEIVHILHGFLRTKRSHNHEGVRHADLAP